jgi:hypothetical protein
VPSLEKPDSTLHNLVLNKPNEKVGKLDTKSTLPIQKNKSNTPKIPKKK